jgi:hypothetical protein
MGGAPQYEVTLSDWNLKPKLADDLFTFQPPPGANPLHAGAPAQRHDHPASK